MQNIIPSIDRLTMEYEPISSIDLMERAARSVFDWVVKNCEKRKAYIVAGPGNNGGDGLAVARMLHDAGWQVEVILYAREAGRRSADNKANLQRLENTGIKLSAYAGQPFDTDNIIIDALFGTGLTRKLDTDTARLVEAMNTSGCQVISIDMPSGMADDGLATTDTDKPTIVQADHTITFQFPKLAFFLPESGTYAGKWHVADIGLSPKAIAETPTTLYYTTPADIAQMTRPRSRFSHKGTYGHAMILAGSFGMMGAAVLATRSCLRSGAGMATTCVPRCGYGIMQTSAPEAMVRCSDSEQSLSWTDRFYDSRIAAVGIGPGLGRDDNGTDFVLATLKQYGGKVPMVIDADGLFHLARIIKEGMASMPPNCILTPHPAEFDRLTELHSTHYQRVMTAKKFAEEKNVTIVLKNAYTTIATPDGTTIWNTTGNSGMATAGSGDVLTGIITGLLAQGYSCTNAAVLGAALHGTAGDMAAKHASEEAMTAADIANMLGQAFGFAGKGRHATATYYETIC